MTPFFHVVCGDCRAVLQEDDESTFDACVTDPPYELGFMGKDWDRSGVAVEAKTWAAVLRVLKPGAHLVAFGGTRTWHRIACAIEDAGFQIRDNLAWLYGQGFPKSLNLPGGIGTALKPSFEPVILARKPLIGTVAANVAEYGTGGLNIDACRTPAEKQTGWGGGGSALYEDGLSRTGGEARPVDGRWPPNVIVDEAIAADLDASYAHMKSGTQTKPLAKGGIWKTEKGNAHAGPQHGDSGGVSRYFYCPKANGKERDAGLDHWPALTGGEMTGREDGTAGVSNPRAGAGRGGGRRNPHPTVKPIALMRWLVRLVTPVGGVVLDPFVGSGSTGAAAVLEGRNFYGIDLDPEHVRLAIARIRHWAG